jgi:hypothetical protein
VRYHVFAGDEFYPTRNDYVDSFNSTAEIKAWLEEDRTQEWVTVFKSTRLGLEEVPSLSWPPRASDPPTTVVKRGSKQ